MRDAAREIGLLAWRCVFPAADEGSWYPGGFMDPIEANEPALDAAVDRIVREVDRLGSEGFGPHQILVGGFSQGACVVCEYLWRHAPGHLAAVVFSGALPGPAGSVWADRHGLAGMRTLLTGSPADPWVPFARMAETAAWLEASGARVQFEVFEDRPHRLDERDFDSGRRFVAGL
jgi:predicted esterase